MALKGRGKQSVFWPKIYDILVNQGQELTAYQLARKVGCTPQHVNRMLAKKWAYGSVTYRVVVSGRGEKRVWGSIYKAENRQDDFNWVCAYERTLV